MRPGTPDPKGNEASVVGVGLSLMQATGLTSTRLRRGLKRLAFATGEAFRVLPGKTGSSVGSILRTKASAFHSQGQTGRQHFSPRSPPSFSYRGSGFAS